MSKGTIKLNKLPEELSCVNLTIKSKIVKSQLKYECSIKHNIKMKFKELKFIRGICQLDYNYYVISFTASQDKNSYSCTIFNRAKLPVDLPGIKTEVIKIIMTKINFSKIEIETLIKNTSIKIKIKTYDERTLYTYFKE